MIGYLNNAIRAKELFKRDKDYVVMNGELLIVDEHTGRMLAGRRIARAYTKHLKLKNELKFKMRIRRLPQSHYRTISAFIRS
jgi:preprotein translocase subunit SecA